MRGPCSAAETILLCVAVAGCGQKRQSPPFDTGRSCSSPSACEPENCLLLDTGKSVCTTTCTSTSQCVPGWTCAALPLESGELCVCTPSPEICDGLDNDCNGVVDDGEAPDEFCAAQTAGWSCVDGKCACALTCDGACVSPRWDSYNCGGCNQICTGDTFCQEGSCQCTPGEVRCGDSCVNLSSANSSCGACGKACPAGELCSSSQCVCPVGEIRCNDVCSNTTFDSSNCGGCGNACDAVSYCANSECTCLPPLIACAGGCLDLSADAANCGTCGNVCASAPGTAATCAQGRCTGVVAVADEPVLALATDSLNLYWIENAGPGLISPLGLIKEIPLLGGDVVTLASGDLNPVALAVDPNYVYWLAGNAVTYDPETRADTWVGDSGALIAIPLLGGAGITFASGMNNPLQTISDGTRVYWDSAGLGAAIGGIQSASVISEELGSAIETGLSLGPLAVDVSNLYWGGSDASIMKLSLDGTVPGTLVAANATATALATEDDTLYWTDSAGEIQEVPAEGGPSSVLTAGPLPAAALAVDTLNLYWTVPGQQSDGEIIEFPLSGGSEVTLASGSQYAGLAIDDASVYYFDQIAGAIMKVSK